MDEVRRGLRLSSVRRTASQFDRDQAEQKAEAEALVKLLQCGICYTIVLLDRQLRQCPSCKNVIFCLICSEKQKNKCGFCNQQDVVFEPIHPNLALII